MKNKNTGVVNAPWEKAFDRILTPFEEFIHQQTTSGILLMLCAVIAMIIANAGGYEAYHKFLNQYIVMGVGDWVLKISIHHWINDGLMAFFFLVIGLELKRELLVGELSNLKQAMLPVIAAIGGMTLPALGYLIFNWGGDTAIGWGVPMATDIAFALGALALMGNRVPMKLLTFLVALAIVDDLGAVMVIAVFYTEQLNLTALAMAGGLVILLVMLNLIGIRKPLMYLLVGGFLWLAMLASGVHATLAGVILAFTIPMQPKYEPSRFLEHAKKLLDRTGQAYAENPDVIHNQQMRAGLQSLKNGVQLTMAPAQALEHHLHLPSAYLIIPIFALANAGIPIEWSELGEVIEHPVTLGIIVGLVLGKLVGIAGFTWLAVKTGVSALPTGVTMSHVVGVGLLGGIGFTMSIFIAELGFAGNEEHLLMAKTGILIASLVAGIGGYLWLRFVAPAAE